MVLEGGKELVDGGTYSGTCSAPTISLPLAALNVINGLFGPKESCFWI